MAKLGFKPEFPYLRALDPNKYNPKPSEVSQFFANYLQRVL